MQRWRTRAITALVVLVQVAGALLAAYWATSYSRSSAEIEQIARNSASTRSQIEGADVHAGSDPRPLLPVLNTLQDLTVSTAPSADEPATPLAGFREHQRIKLAAAARVAYDRILQDSLLRRIVQRCEDQMRSGADSNLQYEALKAYTMMHDAAHFDASSLKAFVIYDWDTTLEPALTSEDRAQLVQHLDALLDAGAAGTGTPADPRLVASVRARLASQPVAQRIATRLKAVLGARSYPEFAVASLGAPAAALFVGKDGHSPPRSVPGRYTLEAYRDGVLTTLPTVPSQLTMEASWVLSGASPRAPGAADAAAAGRAVAEALASYLDGYERTWAGFVEDLRLRSASSDNDVIGQAQALAARDGPLAVLLRAVVQQTSLHDASAPSALGDAAAPLERLVEDRFAPLRELTQQAPDGRRPLDLALVDFNEVHVLRALVASNRGRDSNDTTLRLEHIRVESRRFPEPVRSMLLAVASPVQESSGTDAPARTSSTPPLAQ
jgi:type VI secretion system protein ImpL